MVTEYLAEVRSHYRRMPLADAELTLSALQGCHETCRRAETGGRRQAALNACRSSARLVSGMPGRPRVTSNVGRTGVLPTFLPTILPTFLVGM